MEKSVEDILREKQEIQKILENKIDVECGRVMKEAMIKYLGEYKIKKEESWGRTFNGLMHHIEEFCNKYNVSQVHFLAKMRDILGYGLYRKLKDFHDESRSDKKD